MFIKNKLVLILQLFLLFVACRTLSIADVNSNAYDKFEKSVNAKLESIRTKNTFYSRLAANSRNIMGKYHNIEPNYNQYGGRWCWTANFYKYMCIEKIEFTQNDTTCEGFYYIKEDDLMYHYTYFAVPFRDSLKYNTMPQKLHIEKFPYDIEHYGLKIIHGKDYSLLKPNTKYLITKIRRIAKTKWCVNVKIL